MIINSTDEIKRKLAEAGIIVVDEDSIREKNARWIASLVNPEARKRIQWQCGGDGNTGGFHDMRKECNKKKEDLRAKIFFSRVIDYNHADPKRMKIEGWSNIKREEELPREYLDDYPRFYVSRPDGEQVLNIIVKDLESKSSNYFLRCGDTVSLERFQEILKVMKQAGQRLTDIMADIRKKTAGHEGKFTITI